MRQKLAHRLFVLAALALVVAGGLGIWYAKFLANTALEGPLNPRGEISPASSATLTIVAFGDSKGRTAVFERALADAKAHQPSVLAILGDFVEQNSEFEYRYAHDLVQRAQAEGVTTFVAIGNHEGFDRKGNLSRERYDERFGPTVAWFRTNGVLFVAIDTADERSFPEEQAREVEAILKVERPKSRAAILLTHVPPRRKVELFDKRGFRKQLEFADSVRLLEIAQNHGFSAILAGHYHGFSWDNADDPGIIVEGCGGAPLDQVGGSPGYVTVEVGALPARSVVVTTREVSDSQGVERARYYILRYAPAVVGIAFGLALVSLVASAILSRKSATA